MDAVLGGKQFVSSSLKDYQFTDTSGAEKPAHRHEVLFYSDDAVLLDSVTHFIAVALRPVTQLLCSLRSHTGIVFFRD